MTESTTQSKGGCEEIQEMIAWYPTGAITDEERRMVDDHVSDCTECGDLLQFSSDLKGLLLETASIHPDADALVVFVEDIEALAAEKRVAIEAHLAACHECRKQAEILGAVDDKSAHVSPDRTSAKTRREQDRGPGFWDFLRGGLFGPIPAVVYLAIAVVAIGLQLLPRGPMADGPRVRDIGDTDVFYRTDPRASSLGGVVILPDETDRVRQPDRGEVAITAINKAEPHFILIELTGLESAPDADDVYRVEFVEENSGKPIVTATAPGQMFRDNYTLCLSLQPGELPTGVYVVRVVNPGGDTVYRSSLSVR